MDNNAIYTHSVYLETERCQGCTNCIKRCPTEAIRVRDGKAIITNDRCIDCGECIRACGHNAKKAITDSLTDIKEFKYRVAIPAPALYSQFRSARSRNHLLTALLSVGFDDVYEVAQGAEAISNVTRQYMREEKNIAKPVISTACPAIIKLIQIRFPNLIDNLLPLESPVEVSARRARAKAEKETGYKGSDIGIFFISPCPAKMQTKFVARRGDRPLVDKVVSFQDVYMAMRAAVKALPPEKEKDLATASNFGVRWPNPGGESLALDIKKFIAVDGIHDVIKIFETIEDSEKFDDIDFIEALACNGGCLGGALTVKNVYVSQVIMKSMRDEARGKYHVKNLPPDDIDYHSVLWDTEIEHIPVHKLDDNFAVAIQKLARMEELIKELPSLDCGACGAPNCKALAEDVVKGEAKMTDCVFVLREKVRKLANEMFELESLLPPTMDKTVSNDSDDDMDAYRDDNLENPEGEDSSEGAEGIESKRYGGLYSGDSIKWRNR